MLAQAGETLTGRVGKSYAWLMCAGDLKFEDVSLRYFPGGPLALRHVNFHVQSCEKVRQ